MKSDASLDEQIEKAQERLEKAKAQYDSATADLRKLLEERESRRQKLLMAAIAKSDKSFKVKDASKWAVKDARVVYDADMQGRDLPNYNFFGGRVKSVTKDADGYLVTMTGAIGIDLTPGACVRQHREGRPAIFGSLRKLTGDWQTFEFILGPGITPDGKHGNKIYPNVTQIASWLYVPQGASIRNLQIEEIK